jgi:SulP family sulfate permease
MGVSIPAVDWLRGYDRSYLKPDVVGGLTAAAVVIPKALAYATIAGLPLQVGLYTACLPAVIYSLLGTSRVLSVSTTTTIAILGAAELGAVATAHPDVSLAAATATLAMLVGLILIAARLLRLGFVADFISDPVLTGFKAGIGVVVVVDQIPKLLGIHIDKAGFFHNVASIVSHLPETSGLTLAVALGTFAIIAIFEKFVPRSPVPLIAIGAAIAASVFLALPAQGVSVVGAIPSGFPSITFPDLSVAIAMWPAAAGIALMSYTETIAVGRAFARENDPRPDPNQELVAIGVGSAVGALFGAMPSGGGASQTAVKTSAGARTQFAELVIAAAAAGTMVFLAPVLAPMPNAALAAVVIAYSIGLISPSELAAIRHIRTREFRWAVAAAAGVVLLGTLQGILVAVVLSLASMIHRANNPPLHVLGRKRGTNIFRPRSDENPDDESFPGLLMLRTEGRMYFANAPVLGEKLRDAVSREKPRVLALDCRAIPDFEFTALKMLVSAEARLREQGAELWLVALNPEPLELVQRTSLASLGRDRMFFNLETAVDAYLKRAAT